MVSQRDFTSPPAFQPLQGRLRDAVDGPYPFTGHSKLGAMYNPDVCSLPLQTSAACISGIGAAKTAHAGANWRATDPFIVYTWLDCPLVGSNEEELKQRTKAAHENNAPTLAETVFWTGGDFNTSQHLAEDTAITETVGGSVVTLQTGAITVTGTYDIVEAIGVLEQSMADCYGGTPLIHVPRGAMAHLNSAYLVKEAGARILTIGNRSIVVAAPGYKRTGPDGTLAPLGHAWFYATGSVKMWQSEIMWQSRDVREFLKRDTNDTVLIAEQRFMFGWDCCHFAVLVKLGGIISGGVASPGA